MNHQENCHPVNTQANDWIVPYPPDKPDQHGFLISGHKTIFLNHFMMFGMVDHQYQVILEADLGEAQTELYWRDYIEYPNWVHVLANDPDINKMILPDIVHGYVKSFIYQMYRGFPPNPAPGQPPVLLATAPLTIKRIVAFRHFDLDYNAIYPPMLTYYLYGKGDEAHLSHYVSASPSFQHELNLNRVPEFLSPEELERGVFVSFPNLYMSKDKPLPTENPLPEGAYEVVVRGKTGMYRIDVGTTLWFDTSSINGMAH